MDFKTLYQQHSGDVLRFALYLSGSSAEAEDLTAEAFLRAWISTAPIRVGTVKAYLFMIVRNLNRDRLRKDQPEELNQPVADPQPGPAFEAAARDELQRTLDALQALPEDDRALLAMIAFDQMRHNVIASLLGVSISAVKVRVHRARSKLAALLRAEKKEEP